MTNEEAIKVLLDEWKCIDRNDGINCDRKCESCDLVMDTFVLKDAYNMAIKALEQQSMPTMVYPQVEGITPVVVEPIPKLPPVKPQESSITWVTGADGAKIAFWDVPVWKVTKICEILGEPQERSEKE